MKSLVYSALALVLLAASNQERHVMANNAAAEEPANMTKAAAELQRHDGRVLLSAYEIAGDAGTVQPGVGVWDESTRALVSDQQINLDPPGSLTTAKSNAGHDAPSIVETADGSILVPYGAASTYRGYDPPASWTCFHGIACEPFKYADASVESAKLPEVLARSPLYLLPASGLSEMSSATLGSTTILNGQEQTGAPSGESGAQGYVAYNRGGTFSTSNGAWFFKAGAPPSGDGLYTITRAPTDGAYVSFAIASATGPGEISLSIGGAPCSVSVSGNSGADDAAQFARSAPLRCPALAARFHILAPTYDPLEQKLGSPIGVAAIHPSEVRSLPSSAAVQLRCEGGITCVSPRGANAVYDERASGLHRHFLFGGVTRIGSYFYAVMDVQQVTGSWYGSEHNSYALALACFRASEPRGSIWTWTDCGGGHPFELAPGAAPMERLGGDSPYLVGPPAEGYPNDFSHYIYDWSMQGQPPARSVTYPVISSESIAALRGHLVIAHGCQAANGTDTVCYAELNGNGKTTRVGFVTVPPEGGSLASIALRTDGAGRLALGVLAGIGSKWGCIGSGACAMSFAFDENTGHWNRTAALALGGAPDSGFAGTVRPSQRGFLYQYRDLLGAGRARVITFETQP